MIRRIAAVVQVLMMIGLALLAVGGYRDMRTYEREFGPRVRRCELEGGHALVVHHHVLCIRPVTTMDVT